MLQSFRRWFGCDVAVDLGSANTRLALPGADLLLDEPSVVALQSGTRQVLGRGSAVGKLARQMLGRTPDGMTAVRPVRDGVIHDFELCEQMLRYFFRKAELSGRVRRPRVVVTVPGNLTPVEKQAVFHSFERAGAGQIFLLPQAKAAAIGAGLPISEPLANLVCELGGGTTQVAVLSLSEVVSSHSFRVAGDRLDEAIVAYLRRRLSLRVGLQQAEQLKLKLGSAYPLHQEQTSEVRGLDLVSGIPRRAIVTSEEIREALREPLEAILNGVRTVIEQCDPELVADLAETGLVLSGGTSLLPGLDLLFQERLGIPTRRSNDPRRTVIRGAGICAEHLRQWQPSLEAA